LSFLLDTNVVSELRKGRRCHPKVRAWFEGVDDEEIFLSVLTLGELRRGIENIRRRDKKSAGHLDKWFASLLGQRDRILPIDLAISETWGAINVPDPLPVVDGLIAATARVHGLTVASRNIPDIRRVGVDCVNPFE
jgi:predicted nucleic acid-binding protein